ncbi:hypothetical protein FNU79_08800 [Deinococcus detaillensis]|uniref:Tail specific protease domain-containing protein n=1 Tax=Deinococcus detaillensis TaxID=2592048 RepID=A0A553V088_9DEIO|nr:S41 family peptidase [Deinococcus detaillensis]TSA85872.1 hypothetical protein FNU79_08800 [Deinococcus detaillensis]
MKAFYNSKGVLDHHRLKRNLNSPMGVYMQRKRIVFGITTVFFVGTVAFGQTPLSFGLRALSIIKTRALMSENVNWDAQRAELIRNSGKMKSDQDILPYLGEILLKLNDNHSFYILGHGKVNLYQLAMFYKVKVDSSGLVTVLDQRFPTGLKIGDRILNLGTTSGVTLDVQRAGADIQVRLPDLPLGNSSGFSVDDENGVASLKVPNQMDSRNLDTYYESGIAAIKNHGKSCAWVIDLRDNTGGNLYALIAALSPLLPNGELLSLQEKQGQPIAISIDDRGVDFGDNRAIEFKTRRYISTTQNISLIVNRNTKSAAEMMALIFKKLHHRLYGESTFGAIGYQTIIQLNQQTSLELVTGGALNESGQVQEGAVIPDEEDNSLQSVLAKMSQKGSCQK